MALLDTYIEITTMGNLLLGIFAILPFIINLRYYSKTKILDYLLLSIYFFVWSVLQIFDLWYNGNLVLWFGIDPLQGKVPLLDAFYPYTVPYFFFTLDSLPLFIIAIRAKYGSNYSEIPKWVITIGIITFSLALWSFIDQAQFRVHPEIPGSDSIRIAIFTNRVTFHLFLIFAFITSDYKKTKRTTISRNLWIISSAIWALIMGAGLFYDTILGIELVANPVRFAIIFTILDLGALLLLINHIFFPEAVLITHEHIIIALNTYKKVELANNPLKDFGLSRIKKYLESIPPELIKE